MSTNNQPTVCEKNSHLFHIEHSRRVTRCEVWPVSGFGKADRRHVATSWIRQLAIGAALLMSSLPSLMATEPFGDDQRRSAAVALNYSRAALHRIRRNPSVRVMFEEQEKILNHLDLNGIADEEVMKLYSSVLDEISQTQIADRERIVLRERYERTFQRDLGINAFEIAAQVATAQYVSAVRTGANSWWDHRNLSATHELDIWQVDKKRMTSVVEKSSQFLDVSWKMARAKQIPDRWLVRSDDLDKLEQAQRESDPGVRLRVLKRMESFMECYPPYWYYVARTQQSMGQLFAASETYQKLVTIGNGHFRKDEMLAAGLANRSIIQAFLSQPAAAETARLAMSYSSEAWEANLVCANVLQKYGRYDDAEDAILRNLDVNLERPQSRLALLGLYYTSDNKPKLAMQLQDPDWVKDIPAQQLLMCAAKLGQHEVPAAVIDQLTTSLQGTPRLNIGRDDFVIAVSPAWQLQHAAVSLQWGDRTFSNPRVTGGRDSVLLSFDGVAELGGHLTSGHEIHDVALTIKYPDAAPLKLVLKSKSDASRSHDLSNITFVGRRHPVYRVSSLEQNDFRLSLRQGVPSAELTDVTVPVSRSTGKAVLHTTEDPSNDDSIFVAPH
jgi:tetratricopeptide (TPR) repeat protein